MAQLQAEYHVHGAVLYAGEELAKGHLIRSENGIFTLIMQEDGNFVEYKPGGEALWHSNTQKCGERACLQRDGRLVVFNASGGIAWASNDTPLKPDSYKLVIEYNGNVVLYNGADVPVWSTQKK